MLMFCSACEVPKGDICSGNTDKARENLNVSLAEALALSPNTKLCYNRLEDMIGSCSLSEVGLNDLKVKYSVGQALFP